MSNVTVKVEMDFGAGFVDVTPDVVGSIDVRYGISGSGPLDRVASTGTMRLALNNSEVNSAQLLGYYSPGHTNCRAGFGIGLKCRLTLTFAAVNYTRFWGTIDSIRSMPGIGLERRTGIVVVDWIDSAARTRLTGIPIQLNKTSSETFATILAVVTPPPNYAISYGKDTYAFALDNASAGGATALSEFQRLAQSELGFVYFVGEAIFFENRHMRMANSTNQFMLDATTDLEASRSRDQILNRVQVVVYPRRADTSLVVLFTLDTPFSVAPGQVVTLRASYTDPTLRAEKVGGTEMVPPVSSSSPVQWVTAGAGFANVTMTGSTVKKTGGSGAAWDAGTYSVQRLTSGDGYVQFVVADVAALVMCGFNSDPMTDASFSSIDFALYAATGDFLVYENGTLKYTGTGEAPLGTVLRVQVESGGTVVKYYANGALKYTAITPTITYPLYADCSIFTANAEVTAPIISAAVPDYTMNVAANGSGVDLTAQFSVVAIYGANEVYFTIANNGTQSAYVTTLRPRGKGVYDYSTVMGEAKDDASITKYGENVLTFDMFYQNDPEHGAQAAAYILNVYKNEGSFVQSVSFPASKSDALMVAALDMDISDRIGIRETVTGLTDDGPGTTVLGHHIQNVTLTIEPGGIVWCSWGLAPADAAAYWIMDQVGRSELDVSTKLGFL